MRPAWCTLCLVTLTVFGSSDSGGEDECTPLNGGDTCTYFKIQPQIIAQIFDTNDENCDKYTDSPAVSDKADPLYPRDSTGDLRQNRAACGISPIRLTFKTSDIDGYDHPEESSMFIHLKMLVAGFTESNTCSAILDATGEFPGISSCRFTAKEAMITLATRLKRNKEYSLTIKILNPPGEATVALNSVDKLKELFGKLELNPPDVADKYKLTDIFRVGDFSDPTSLILRKGDQLLLRNSLQGKAAVILESDLTTLALPAALDFYHEYLASENTLHVKIGFFQVATIERTSAPVEISHVIHNAKHSSYSTPGQLPDFDKRGYITKFIWRPDEGYSNKPGESTRFTFGIRTFGLMGKDDTDYVWDFIAHPTNVWRFGQANTQCDKTWMKPIQSTTCELMAFPGATADQANGFRITITTNPADNANTQMVVPLQNPTTPVNMIWTATSYKIKKGNSLMAEPFTVLLDKAISVQGVPKGSLTEWELPSINAEQWVTMEFYPNIVVAPEITGESGYIFIIPPDGFTVFESAEPMPIPGKNPLPCTWPQADREQNRWKCIITDRTIFASTLYSVKLKVINSAKVEQAKAWRLEIWQSSDAVKPIAITRDIRGFATAGTMIATLAPENQLMAASNMVQFEFIPSQDVGAQANATFSMIAPPGFKIIKRCSKFRAISLPPVRCKGSDSNSAVLQFFGPDAIQQNKRYIFEMEVENPSDNVVENHFWRFQTVRPDGIGKDTARYEGFFLYPSAFLGFSITTESRRPGPRLIIVRFRPQVDIPYDDYLRVRAPKGYIWDQDPAQFTTDSAITMARDIDLSQPNFPPDAGGGTIVMRLNANAYADFEYGFRALCTVPDVTPAPNRWWIEQYRSTGAVAWAYIASMGGEGFNTQVLVGGQVLPYNRVRNAWANPTQVIFQTTTTVRTTSGSGSSARKIAHILLQAPVGFTYTCPLLDTRIVPPGGVKLPPVECVVHQNDDKDRRNLYLQFLNPNHTGLDADVMYVFTVDVTNAAIVNPTENFFTISIFLGDEIIEETRVAGYDLAAPMENTRYIPDKEGHDKRVGATNNKITFVIGLTREVPMPPNSLLEIKAPRGFVFDRNCFAEVGHAHWMGSTDYLAFPAIASCENREAHGPYENIAHIIVSDEWPKGTYAMFVTVENPSTTPEENNWSATIYEPGGIEATMAEASIVGFNIQEVIHVGLFPYNPANAFPGEAAPNPIDVSFVLTTRVPEHAAFQNEGGSIIIAAPVGFYFPNVCRQFETKVNIETPVGKTKPLPEKTQCIGGLVDLTRVDYRTDNQRFNARFPKIKISEDVHFNHGGDGIGPDDDITVTWIAANGPAAETSVHVGYKLTNIHVEGETSFQWYDKNAPVVPGVEATQPPQARTWQQHMSTRRENITQFLRAIEGEVKGPIWLTFAGPAVKLTLPTEEFLVPGVPYGFRLFVENPPDVFDNVEDDERLWTIETRRGAADIDTRIDLNRRVPSFPIHERIRFFALHTLSQTGRKKTTLRLIFGLFHDLLPQKTVTFITPEEVQLTVGNCAIDSLVEHLFENTLMKDIEARPEWLHCSVTSSNIITVINSNDVRGGKSLRSGPTYQIFISDVTNPESTPKLNLWRVIANTAVQMEKEIWATEGYEIFPELAEATVVSANPAVGLYTNFTFHLKTVSEVPMGGSVKIVGPSPEIYFGPRLSTDDRDELNVAPRPSPCEPHIDPTCKEKVFPGPDEVVRCSVEVPESIEFVCPLQFQPCIEAEELREMHERAANPPTSSEVATLQKFQINCDRFKKLCDDRKYDELFSCESVQNKLELTLNEETSIPSGAVVDFLVKGYNQGGNDRRLSGNSECDAGMCRTNPSESRRGLIEEDGTTGAWLFATQNSDSAKTVLDEKASVPGYKLLGVINVKSIVPSKSKVSTNENKVTIILQLNTVVPPRGRIKITHPPAFVKDESRQGFFEAVETGKTIPRKAAKSHQDGVVLVELLEESFPRAQDLTISITLANPDISPPAAENIWKFQTFYGTTLGDKDLDESEMTPLDCNFDADGFRIYGEFREAKVIGSILSPQAKNLLAVIFMLESDLRRTEGETIWMRIWVPIGFTPEPGCGGGEFSLGVEKHKFATSKIPLPDEKDFVPLPAATRCFTCIDNVDPCTAFQEDGPAYILLRLDSTLELGVDYAFQFAMKNAWTNLEDQSLNYFRFETLRDEVVLHFKPRVESFLLEQIRMVTITPGDTSSLKPNWITFSFMSDKQVSGESTIRIDAPLGFTFACQRFVVSGLSTTTTCAEARNTVKFTLDPQDPKKPNYPFSMQVQVMNPEYTPQPNNWNFRIITVLNYYVDVRYDVPGFSVTGSISDAKVVPGFVFLGQKNKVDVVFHPTTIMNQADSYNEIELIAPVGFQFPVVCSRFQIKLTERTPPAFGEPALFPINYYKRNGKQMAFPNPLTRCIGHGNNTVRIRFPEGTGLLLNSYTLSVEVLNPKEPILANCTSLLAHPSNFWTLITRVNSDANGTKIVDANRTIPGFCVQQLLKVKDVEENGASNMHSFSLARIIALSLIWWFVI